MGRHIPMKKRESDHHIRNKEFGNTYVRGAYQFFLLTYDMRVKEGLQEEKVKKKKIGVSLKSTKNEESESSDEVDEDKEMTMFAKRFKKFIKSNKGRIFQRKK
ncbi:hypothetical protein EPI10_006328 [Gossypium australe]|uniref:Uncharacterized protein n=1 Tax=Gossypium australe TaxID=47621 RepID=A0A5B6WS06_9ROSI|nr:hypothetical protein EPI10_006328 [Gossypium australe]